MIFSANASPDTGLSPCQYHSNRESQSVKTSLSVMTADPQPGSPADYGPAGLRR